MYVSFYPSPEINEIMSIPENKTCFDCGNLYKIYFKLLLGEENPKWTSINNAVFLCGKCAFFHKTLPPEISTVKSLDTEVFTAKEILLLKIGGNARFSSLLAQYEILTATEEQEFRYILNISDFHRKLLVFEMNRDVDPDSYETLLSNRPSLEEGVKVIESYTKKLQQELAHQEFKQDSTGFFGTVGSFLSGVGNKVADLAKTGAEKIGIDKPILKIKTSIEENETVQKVASTASSVITGAGELIKKGANKIMETDVAKGIAKKAEESYIALKRKIQGREPPSQQNNENPQ